MVLMNRRQERARVRWWLCVAWASLLIVTVALVGDISEPGGDDYLMDPSQVGRTTSVIAVLVSIPLLVLSSRALWCAQRPRTRLWRKAVALFLATAVIAGYGYRVMTAGVSGANIGGGMFMMFGLPLIATGLAASWFMARRSHSPLED